MASRVNIKFVAILAASLVVVAAMAAVIGLVVYKKSGADYESAGDQAMTEQDYATAQRMYGGAVHHDPNNVVWLAKFRDAIVANVPETKTQYYENYAKYLGVIRQTAMIKRTDVQAHADLLDELYGPLRISSFDRRGFEQLMAATSDALRYFSDTSSDRSWQHLRRFRGLSRVRMLTEGLRQSDEEMKQAEEDLLAALEAESGDAESVIGLALIASRRAQSAREHDNIIESEEHLEAAQRYLTDFLADNPGRYTVALVSLEVAIMIRTQELGGKLTGRERNEALAPVRAEMAGRFTDAADMMLDADPTTIDRVAIARLHRLARMLNDEERTEEILQYALAARPDAAGVRLLAAQFRAEDGRYIEAVEELQKIIDLPSPNISLEGIVLFSLKTNARVEQCRVLALRWATLAEEPEADEALAEAKRYRDLLAEEIPEDSGVLKLVDGRIAWAEGDLQTAELLISQYNEETGIVDPDAQWILGQIAFQLEKWGIAKDAFEKVYNVQRNNFGALEKLVQIHARLEDFHQADIYAELLVALAPDDERAQEAFRAVQVMSGKIKSDDPIVAAQIEARRLAKGSGLEIVDTSGAVEVLQAARAAHGNDPRLVADLVRLLSFQGHRDEAVEIVEAGIAEHPDDRTLTRMLTALTTEDIVGATLVAINESDMTAIEKAVARYRLFTTHGQTTRGAEALAQARDLNPDNPAVIELSFREAIVAEDWARAESLADAAADGDVDRVGGLAFRAEVKRAQGDVRQAIALLQDASAANPNNALIWRRLGIALQQNGQTQDALASFSAALKIKPDDINTNSMYVSMLSELGRHQDALDAARNSERFAGSDGKFFDIWMNLELRYGDQEFALSRRQQLFEDRPENTLNSYSLANALIEAERWDDAQSVIQTLRAKADHIDLARLEARLYADQGDLQAARIVFVEYILDQEPEELTALPYLVFGRFMIEHDDVERGLAAINEGRQYQSPERLEADRMLGETYAQLGLRDQAVEVLRRVIDGGADTETGSFAMRLIETLLQMERFEEALVELEKFDEADRQENVMLRLLEAEAAGRSGDIDRAIKLLDAAAASFPDNPMVFLTRARVLASDRSRSTDAIADLNTVLEMAPEMWQAYEIRGSIHAASGTDGGVDRAIEDFKLAIGVNPYLDLLRTNLMLSLCQLDRADEAAQLGDEAIERRPRDDQLILETAQMFDRQGLPEHAAHFYGRAWDRKQFPALCQWYITALVQIDPPKVDRAESVLSAYVEQIDADPGLLVTRAMVHAAKNDIPSAADDCTAAFALLGTGSGHMSAWFNSVNTVFRNDADVIDGFLTVLQSRTQTSRWPDFFRAQMKFADEATRPEAIAIFTELSESDSGVEMRSKAIQSLGTSSYADADYQRAAELWQRGLDLFSDDWEMSNNLAFVLAVHLDRPEEAVPLAEQAIRLNPRALDAYDTLGIVLHRVGRFDEAEDAYRMGLRLLAPATAGAADLRLKLTELYLDAGRIDDAKREVARVDRIIQTNSAAQRYQSKLDSLKQRIPSQP